MSAPYVPRIRLYQDWLRASRGLDFASYDALWQYAWTHFVDHEHGAWYRILSPDNRRLGREKSPPGKTDYHTIGACVDVLEALGDAWARPTPNKPTTQVRINRH